jgi:hypothetical protein
MYLRWCRENVRVNVGLLYHSIRISRGLLGPYHVWHILGLASPRSRLCVEIDTPRLHGDTQGLRRPQRDPDVRETPPLEGDAATLMQRHLKRQPASTAHQRAIQPIADESGWSNRLVDNAARPAAPPPPPPAAGPPHHRPSDNWSLLGRDKMGAQGH